MSFLKLIYFDTSLNDMLDVICHSYSTHYPISNNLILVYTRETTKEIYEKFENISNQKHFFVIELDNRSGAYWGFMDENLWDWLRERAQDRIKLYDVKLDIKIGSYKGLETIPLYSNDTVQDILDRVYKKIHSEVRPYTYLSSWILKNDSTSSYLIVSYDISIKIPASDMFLKDTCWSVVNKNIDNEVLKTNQIRFL